jgi:hypothetical protein
VSEDVLSIGQIYGEYCVDIINFEQGNAKSLYDTCERLRGYVESFMHLYGEACRNHQLND